MMLILGLAGAHETARAAPPAFPFYELSFINGNAGTSAEPIGAPVIAAKAICESRPVTVGGLTGVQYLPCAQDASSLVVTDTGGAEVARGSSADGSVRVQTDRFGVGSHAKFSLGGSERFDVVFRGPTIEGSCGSATISGQLELPPEQDLAGPWGGVLVGLRFGQTMARAVLDGNGRYTAQLGLPLLPGDFVRAYQSIPTSTAPDGLVLHVYTEANAIPCPAVVNHPPVARPDSWKIAPGKRLAAAAAGVLANDSDPDGDRISAKVVSTSFAPAEWSGLATDGAFTYSAPKSLRRALQKRVTYVAVDSKGAQSQPTTATVTVVPPPKPRHSVAFTFHWRSCKQRTPCCTWKHLCRVTGSLGRGTYAQVKGYHNATWALRFKRGGFRIQAATFQPPLWSVRGHSGTGIYADVDGGGTFLWPGYQGVPRTSPVRFKGKLSY